MEHGDVSKKQLTKIYGIEFQKEIILNNNQLPSTLIILIDKTSINLHVSGKIHLLELLDILKQLIKWNLFLDFTEILTLKKPLKEIHSEKPMDKIIKLPTHMLLKNQL